MTVNKKIKTTDKNSKTKFNRQAAKISALSSRNNNKYEFLIAQVVLPEKVLVEKCYSRKI